MGALTEALHRALIKWLIGARPVAMNCEVRGELRFLGEGGFTDQVVITPPVS